MSLLFLTSEDYHVENGPQKPLLGHTISGFSLILFYSNKCPTCKPIYEVFKQLPGTVNGCQFGMINVSTSKKVVEMSQSTTSPLTYVPYIILYLNGKPIMAYEDDSVPTVNKIQNFIREIAQNIRHKQQFSKERVKEPSNEHPQTAQNIHKYCLGIPVSGDKNSQVCYLEFSESYRKT